MDLLTLIDPSTTTTMNVWSEIEDDQTTQASPKHRRYEANIKISQNYHGRNEDGGKIKGKE